MRQYNGNAHSAKELVGDGQPDDRGRSVEELLQPDIHITNIMKADADMIYTMAKLEVIDDMVH